MGVVDVSVKMAAKRQFFFQSMGVMVFLRFLFLSFRLNSNSSCWSSFCARRPRADRNDHNWSRYINTKPRPRVVIKTDETWVLRVHPATGKDIVCGAIISSQPVTGPFWGSFDPPAGS
jgi:hypothetical protein